MRENFIIQKDKGLKTLITDLDKISLISEPLIDQDEDALSLMIDETHKGIDIRKEYPLIFRILQKNIELRQRFLDALNVIDSETTSGSRLVHAIFDQETNFFQSDNKGESFRFAIQQSIEQLQSIFFPSQNLVYRGPSDHEPHYMLLNEEIELQPVTYSIMLEGTLSDEPDMFSLEVDLAISEAGEDAAAALPVDLNITWGNYSQHLILNDEGLTTLTDVPLSAFLNADFTLVTAAMELSLSRPQ